MPSNGSNAVPGVKRSEIADAVQNLTKLPATTLDDPQRFTVEVRAIVESRAQSAWKGEGTEDVAVFVLAPYPRQTGQKFGAKPVSDLIATKDPILGRLFFLNRDASTGRTMKLPTTSNSILEWLTDKGLGTLPVAIAYRSKMLLVSRLGGVTSDTQKDVIREKTPAATLTEVESALKHSHRNFLVTPKVCPTGVWTQGQSSKYIPGDRPEKSIQRELVITLSSWFHGVLKVESEDVVSIGRIDVRLLLQGSDLKFYYWVILELKVIKSSHAPTKKKVKVVLPSENAETIAEGIRQAYAFGKNRNAEAFLEIYDLRKEKSEDPLIHKAVIDALALCSPRPSCRLWPLFGSSSHARKAGWY